MCRRANLIPQLVPASRGTLRTDRELFGELAQKRRAALAADGDPARRGAAESALAQPAGRLAGLAETYPDLKASENFIDLRKPLAGTEDKAFAGAED
jgi:LemA protein